MRIYLDNCCYNRPYDDQSHIRISLETQAKLIVQALISSKEIELVSSYVLQFENSQNPYIMRREQISDFIDNNTRIFVSNSKRDIVEQNAITIMETGIKFKDACHIACAILSKCDYLLTTDDRMLKYKSNDIQLINPIDFVAFEVSKNE